MTPYDVVDHGQQWREVAAAVAYLDATTHPGFTVWDALDTAVRDWVAGLLDTDASDTLDHGMWDDPDRLCTALLALFDATAPAGSPGGMPLGELLSAALAAWVTTVSDDVNDGHAFTAHG